MHYEDSKIQMVSLPYVGLLEMYVLLPKDSMETFVSDLTASNWSRWTAGMHERAVVLELPRFELIVDHDLRGALERLGVRQAFASDAADFTGNSAQKL
jgi:serpin B